MAMRRWVMMWLALLPWLAAAQGPKPDWCDAETRRLRYPDIDWFTGYASGAVRSGETLDAAMQRVRTAAQGDAAQRIQVRVESASLDAVQSAQRQTSAGLDEEIVSLFRRETTVSAELELPNLQSFTWGDPATGEVAALVCTRRRDFVRFYDRQIEALLGKMEIAADNALQLEQQGAQIKGRATAEEALQACRQVEEAQRMVALADVNASLEDLQMSRYTSVAKRLTDIVTRLRHATAFFVDCRASIGDSPYTMLDKEVRGLLAEYGCQFTDDRQLADWVIEVNASVVNIEHREGMATFAYVDGSLTVHNGRTGKRLLDDRLSALEPNHYDGIKGGDFKADRAARQAYREAARIIAEAVMKLVKE